MLGQRPKHRANVGFKDAPAGVALLLQGEAEVSPIRARVALTGMSEDRVMSAIGVFVIEDPRGWYAPKVTMAVYTFGYMNYIMLV